MPSDRFEWTDELLMEFGNYYRTTETVFGPNPFAIVEQFKQSKIKEKERIEVRSVWFEDDDRDNGGGIYKFNTTKQFPPRKLLEIAISIEKILNNEQPKVTPSDIVDTWMNKERSFSKQVDDYVNETLRQDAINQLLSERPQPLSGELITKEECERRERAAWDFAREKYAIDSNPFNKQYRFLSFDQYKSHYQQSLKTK